MLFLLLSSTVQENVSAIAVIFLAELMREIRAWSTRRRLRELEQLQQSRPARRRNPRPKTNQT